MNVRDVATAFRLAFLVASAAPEPPAAPAASLLFIFLGVLVALLFSCDFVVDIQCTLGKYSLTLLDNICKRKLMRMSKFWD
jgi:hypothetical protein